MYLYIYYLFLYIIYLFISYIYYFFVLHIIFINYFYMYIYFEILFILFYPLCFVFFRLVYSFSVIQFPLLFVSIYLVFIDLEHFWQLCIFLCKRWLNISNKNWPAAIIFLKQCLFFRNFFSVFDLYPFWGPFNLPMWPIIPLQQCLFNVLIPIVEIIFLCISTVERISAESNKMRKLNSLKIVYHIYFTQTLKGYFRSLKM